MTTTASAPSANALNVRRERGRRSSGGGENPMQRARAAIARCSLKGSDHPCRIPQQSRMTGPKVLIVAPVERSPKKRT